ncbi:MAG: hypothetical protein Q9165_008624 [Trypethelium subeluteriae]
MAPLMGHIFARQNSYVNLNGPLSAFADEWSAPSNYAFTILLLLGGDVVSRALAQLAGGWYTPVAFSFGWVSYATSAVNSAVGEMKLMPGSDTPCTVINVSSGQSRSNGSWILGRIMRDFEYWMRQDGLEVHTMVTELRDNKFKWDIAQARDANSSEKALKKIERPKLAGLVVSFWKVDEMKRSRVGNPGMDILFWSGVVTSIVQLGVAAIPFGVYGDWGYFLVTAAAILLCLLTGCQKQWKREKWACRFFEKGDKPRHYVMTRGNGAQHALIIECNGVGLNLEDLCTGFDNLDSPAISIATRFAMVGLAVLWVCLLITSSALTDHAWFLIAVGSIGMLQNIFVAGWSRKPEDLGLPLKFDGVIGHRKVIETLYKVEERLPKAGQRLAGEFFPAGLRKDEEEKLKGIGEEAVNKEAHKPEMMN